VWVKKISTFACINNKEIFTLALGEQHIQSTRSVICAFFVQQLTNGILEGINNKIQMPKEEQGATET